jgi:hypothetical protein
VNKTALFYKWIKAADLLILCADRSEPLVVVPLRLAAEIAQAAGRVKEIQKWT